MKTQVTQKNHRRLNQISVPIPIANPKIIVFDVSDEMAFRAPDRSPCAPKEQAGSGIRGERVKGINAVRKLFIFPTQLQKDFPPCQSPSLRRLPV